jgi:hypothetical protein
MSLKFKITPSVDCLTVGVDETNVAASSVISDSKVGVPVAKAVMSNDGVLLQIRWTLGRGCGQRKWQSSSGLPEDCAVNAVDIVTGTQQHRRYRTVSAHLDR